MYHVKLASRKRLLTLGLLEEENRGDKAFARLGTRVRAFIATLDPLFKFSAELPVKVCPFSEYLSLYANLWHQLHECQTLKVQYESVVDWCLHCDVLRCNPLFYRKKRWDCVLVNSSKGVSPA
jgi:hypothetical protein